MLAGAMRANLLFFYQEELELRLIFVLLLVSKLADEVSPRIIHLFAVFLSLETSGKEHNAHML